MLLVSGRSGLLAAAVLLLLLLAPGCISRVLEIRSEPSGAMVYLDGEELGTTPLTHHFTHYGARRVVLAKELCESRAETVSIRAPWWGWFPFDFFVELWPAEVVDRHEISFALAAAEGPQASVDRMLSNLDKLRQKLSPRK
jgi:hypothetical protein